MVERYNGIEADPEGVYVMFEDYERLTAEVTSLRGLVRAVASETSIPMEEIEQSIDAASGSQVEALDKEIQK